MSGYGVPWNQDEDAYLKANYLGKTDIVLATEIPGRTSNAITNRRHILGLLRPAGKPFTKAWPPEKLNRMVALLKSGLPPSEVGKKMGMSRHAVIGKCFRCFGGVGQLLKNNKTPEKAPHVEPPKKVEVIKVRKDRTFAKQCNTPRCNGTQQPGRYYCAICLTAAYIIRQTA